MAPTKKQADTPVIFKKKVLKALEAVLDPELHISIVDLGLVYDVKRDKNNMTHISMTLTTMGCPLFHVIEQEIHNKLYKIGVEPVKITLTFEPPWNMTMLSERGKAMLGI